MARCDGLDVPCGLQRRSPNTGAMTTGRGHGTGKIGLFGGTFDPIHLGHLVVADEIRARCGLDKVVLAPSACPPHKVEACVASAQDRTAMVRLAIRGHSCFALSTIELDREGPSYTVDTLRALRSVWGPGTQIFFIIGQDNVAEIASWRAPEEILRLCTVTVASRPGTPAKPIDPALAQRMTFVPVPPIEVSSTDIRRRIRCGEPFRYLVPPAVGAYILRHGLYRAAQGAKG